MNFRVFETLAAETGSSVTPKKAIIRRPIDLLFLAFFSISILYGFLFSLPEGLGVPVSADSPWPPLRALHGWAVAEEPAHLNPPPNLIAATLFDGLLSGAHTAVCRCRIDSSTPLACARRSYLCGRGDDEYVFLLCTNIFGRSPAPQLGLLFSF